MFIDNLIVSAKLSYLNIYIAVFVLVFLTIASIYDIKYRKIPDKLNLTFLIGRILLIFVIGFSWNNIFGMLIGLFTILIPAMIKNKPMGGDIKTMAVLGLYLGGYGVFALLVTTVVISLAYTLIVNYIMKSKLDIPFAPFFLIAYLIISTALILI